VSVETGSLVIVGATFTKNIGNKNGGGALVRGASSFVAQGVTFTQNFARVGAGGYFLSSPANITDGSFLNNRGDRGVGLAMFNGKIRLANLKFENNTSDYEGGAM
jgi:hypothetical protein